MRGSEVVILQLGRFCRRVSLALCSIHGIESRTPVCVACDSPEEMMPSVMTVMLADDWTGNRKDVFVNR
jgi:hypothetical protein